MSGLIKDLITKFIKQHKNSKHRIDFVLDAILDIGADNYNLILNTKEVFSNFKTLFPDALFLVNANRNIIDGAVVYLPKSKSCIQVKWYIDCEIDWNKLVYPYPIELVIEPSFSNDFVIWNGKHILSNQHLIPLAPIKRLRIKREAPLFTDSAKILDSPFIYQILKYYPVEVLLSHVKGDSLIYPDRAVLLRTEQSKQVVWKIVYPTEVISDEYFNGLILGE